MSRDDDRREHDDALNVERFRTALLMSPAVVFNQDRDLRYTWIHNPKDPFAAEQVLGKTDADLLPPEDARPMMAIKRRVLETGVGARERVRTTIAGRRYCYDLTVEPLRDAADRIDGITGASWEVTDLVEAQSALRESEERFRLLAESAPDLIYLYRLEPERGFEYVSPDATAMTGYTPEEHYADPDLGFAIVHPEDRHLLRSIIEKEHFGTVELRWIRKDGSLLWCEQRNVPVRDEHGKVVAIQGIARDVTQRRRLEDEQRFLADVGEVLASSLEYDTTLERAARRSLPLMGDFCIVDVIDDGALRRVTVAAAEPSREPLARQLAEFPLDRRRPHLATAAVRTQQPVLVREVSGDFLDAVAQNDEHRALLSKLEPASFLAVPLLIRGKLEGVLMFFSSDPRRRFDDQDVRLAGELARRCAVAIDSARLYEQAQAAVEARDRLMSVVAHDLRTPLGTVLLQTELLAALPDPDGRLGRSSARIRRAAERMKRLVDDLLDVARLEAGRLGLNRTPVEPGQLVGEAVDLQRPVAEAAGLDLDARVADSPPPVFADRDRIAQVLDNLVGNAIKFTPAGGSITLSATLFGGGVLFAVEDTGPGIPSEQLAGLFDVFRQLGRADARGAGLGLAITKGIVEAHGGRVWVESAPGAGCTFYFTLPLAAERR